MTVRLAEAVIPSQRPRARHDLPAAPVARPHLSRAIEYASDALTLAALAFLLPFGILMVGAPVALGLRALLGLFGWV
jgi:hypothetical protein